MHPRAAHADGAAGLPIGWIVNLASDDVELAKASRVAARVRRRVPRCQANGFRVDEPERGHPVLAQVSMTCWTSGPPRSGRHGGGRRAGRRDGVELAESELIGLAPGGGAAMSRIAPGPRPTRRWRIASPPPPGDPPVRDLHAPDGARGAAGRRALTGRRSADRGRPGVGEAPCLLIHGASQVPTLAAGSGVGPPRETWRCWTQPRPAVRARRAPRWSPAGKGRSSAWGLATAWSGAWS